MENHKYMRLNDDFLRLVIICLCVVIIYLFILTPLELNAQGYIFFQNLITKTAHSFFYNNSKEPDIILIALDDASLDYQQLKWPWRRSSFVWIIEKIDALDPSVIALDIAFMGESGYGIEDDIALSAALKKTGSVVLASYISKDGIDIQPFKTLGDSAKAVGFVNKLHDDYNMIRYARVVIPRAGKFDYCFEVKTAAIYKRIPLDKISVSNKQLTMGDKKIPVNANGTFLIKYTYKPENIKIIPVKDILSGNYSGSLFKDKIVLFGLTAISLHDIHFTPLGNMPGAVVSANTIANILNGDCLTPLPTVFLFLSFLFLALLASYTGYRYAGLSSFLIITLLSVAAYLFSVFMFKINIIIDVFGLIAILYGLWAITKLYAYGKSYFYRIKMLNLLTIDDKTGIYNLYYLLVRMQQYIDTAKSGENSLAVIVFKLKDNASVDVAANDDFNDKAVLHAASIIKDAGLARDSIIARISDLELGVMVSRVTKDRLTGFVEDIYTRLNNKEIAYPDKNIKHVIGISIGACHGKDITKKSARFLLYVAQNMADKALSLDGKNIRVFNELQDNIPLLTNDVKDVADESRLVDFILDDVKRKNTQLMEEIDALKLRIKRLTDSNFDVILSLVKALEEKDIYTAGHSERVADYSVKLAGKLNLGEKAIEVIKKAAFLHDIGKISIPDGLLHKKEGLTSDDINIIQRHEIESVRILEPIEFLKDAAPLILHHHERFDGNGYPHGLAGERIPLGARIIAIADSFDAMTSGRGYNKPLTTQEAIAILKKESGRQFDPELIGNFIHIISDK